MERLKDVYKRQAFYLADTVIYHPVIGYIYIQTPNSDMRGVQSGKKYADTIRFCTQSLQFLLEKHASPNIKNHLSSYYLKVLRKYKNYLSKLTETEIDAFIEAISEMCIRDSLKKVIKLEVLFQGMQ